MDLPLSLLPMALFALLFAGVVVVSRRRAAKRAAQVAEPLSGIGGWLLLLVLGLTGLAPLVGGPRIASDIATAEAQNPALGSVARWSTFKTCAWLAFGVTTLISIGAGVGLLRKRTPSAVTQAKVALWPVGPCSALVMAVVIPLLVFESAPVTGEVVGAVVASAIPAAIWHAYLSRSTRVRNSFSQRSEA